MWNIPLFHVSISNGKRLPSVNEMLWSVWCVQLKHGVWRNLFYETDARALKENRNSKEIKQILPILGSTAKVKTTWFGRRRV